MAGGFSCEKRGFRPSRGESVTLRVRFTTGLAQPPVLACVNETKAPGAGVGSDGTVAFTTLGRAMAIAPDGTLLWHLPSSAIDAGVYFRDAVIDDQGRVYIGGYDASNVDCFEAVLVRISW